MIDKALVQRSAATAINTSTTSTTTTTTTVWSSMMSSWKTMIRHPIQFIRSPTFLWMWGTYAVTYSAANTLRTILQHAPPPTTNKDKNKLQQQQHINSPPESRHPRTNKGYYSANNSNQYYTFFSPSTTLLIGTSIANSTASVMKDRVYAQLYGATTNTTTNSTKNSSTGIKAGTSSSVVPKITYGLWILRDLTVIGAAFVLPRHVAQFVISAQQQQAQCNSGNENTNRRHFGSLRQWQFSDTTILRLAQIGTPVLAQVIAGPLHFIGYDCYNYRNLSSSSSMSLPLSSYQFWSDRLHHLKSSFGQVITARMMRIIPGYGIAGICNTELLSQWKYHMVQPSMNWSSSRCCDNVNHRHHDPTTTPNVTTQNVTTTIWNHHNQQRC